MSVGSRLFVRLFVFAGVSFRYPHSSRLPVNNRIHMVLKYKYVWKCDLLEHNGGLAGHKPRKTIRGAFHNKSKLSINILLLGTPVERQGKTLSWDPFCSLFRGL